jgi:hypothetical protein
MSSNRGCSPRATENNKTAIRDRVNAFFEKYSRRWTLPRNTENPPSRPISYVGSLRLIYDMFVVLSILIPNSQVVRCRFLFVGGMVAASAHRCCLPRAGTRRTNRTTNCPLGYICNEKLKDDVLPFLLFYDG